MEVKVKVKGEWQTFNGIPCGNGDIIEIRNFHKNGSSRYVSGKGDKWHKVVRVGAYNCNCEGKMEHQYGCLYFLDI